MRVLAVTAFLLLARISSLDAQTEVLEHRQSRLAVNESVLATIGRISHIVEGPSGERALVDQTTSRVYVLKHDGSLKCAFGRSGSGPGEFRIITGLWPTHSGFVLFDAATSRTTVVRHDCVILESTSTPPLRGRPAFVVGVTRSSISLLTQVDASTVSRDGLLSRDLSLALTSARGPIREIATIAGSFVYNVNQGVSTTGYDVPFLSRAHLAAWDSGFVFVPRDSRTLQIMGPDWRLLSAIELPVADAPYSRDVINRHRDSLLATIARAGPNRFPGARERIEYAFGERFPRVTRFASVTDVRAGGGFAYVRAAALGGDIQRWFVVRLANPRVLGEMRIPASVRVVGAAASGIFGVVLSEDDEEVPVVYVPSGPSTASSNDNK